MIFKDKILNPFIAAGGSGMIVDAYNGDNFDHSSLGFVGGGYMGATQTGARPISTRPVPAAPPNGEVSSKKPRHRPTGKGSRSCVMGSCYSYRDCFLDLDPTYKDRF